MLFHRFIPFCFFLVSFPNLEAFSYDVDTFVFDGKDSNTDRKEKGFISVVYGCRVGNQEGPCVDTSNLCTSQGGDMVGYCFYNGKYEGVCCPGLNPASAVLTTKPPQHAVNINFTIFPTMTTHQPNTTYPTFPSLNLTTTQAPNISFPTFPSLNYTTTQAPNISFPTFPTLNFTTTQAPNISFPTFPSINYTTTQAPNISFPTFPSLNYTNTQAPNISFPTFPSLNFTTTQAPNISFPTFPSLNFTTTPISNNSTTSTTTTTTTASSTTTESTTPITIHFTTVSEAVTEVSDGASQDVTMVSEEISTVFDDISTVSEDASTVASTVNELVTSIVTMVSEEITTAFEDVSTVSEDATTVAATVSEIITSVSEEATGISEVITSVSEEVTSPSVTTEEVNTTTTASPSFDVPGAPNSCGKITSELQSNFTNPSYPYLDYVTNIHEISIMPQDGYCGLQIDFLQARLAKKSRDGCLTDFVVILNEEDSPLTPFCGRLDGYGLNITTTPEAPVKIAVTTQSHAYLWKIKSTQIHCSIFRHHQQNPRYGQLGARNA